MDMDKTQQKRLEQLVRQGMVPSSKLQILMRAISKTKMGSMLTPDERNILSVYLEKMQSFVLSDQEFNRAKLSTQKMKYHTEETTVDLDEKVRVVDGPEEMEVQAREKEQRKAKRLSIRKREKYRLLSPELKKEKKKAGLDEEIVELNNAYHEMFEATLEYFEVSNIRDLPEDKKAEFFATVDEALEEGYYKDMDTNKKENERLAKKDHDGDGKIETSTAEYMGSRDKAIKKAMGKKVKEEVEQVDELKKSTLSSYIQKAADPVAKKSNVNLASKAAHKLATSDDMDAGEKEDRKAFVRSKGIQTAAKKLAKEETELDEAMTPDFKAKRLDMIRQAHDRVLTGKTRGAAAAKAAAKSAMKQKGAQKGMAPTKKDEVEEQVQELRKMIKENNNKAEAYKLLAKILNNAENLGEQ